MDRHKEEEQRMRNMDTAQGINQGVDQGNMRKEDRRREKQHVWNRWEYAQEK